MTDKVIMTTTTCMRAIGAAAIAVALAAPLNAQGVGVTLVGETAGDDVNLFLAEGNWSAGGIGISPVAALQTYLVTFDDDAGTSTWSVAPMVGLRYGMRGGFLQGRVGYAFKGPGDAGGSNFFGGAEDGVTASAHAQWWGNGAFGLQGIASHNFGSDYLWSRARGTVRVVPSMGGGDLHAGAEASWQGDIGEEEVFGGVTAPNYSAVMYGPLVQWSTRNVTGVLGAGWKNVDQDFVPEGEDSTWYGKFELVFTPRW